MATSRSVPPRSNEERRAARRAERRRVRKMRQTGVPFPGAPLKPRPGEQGRLMGE